MDKQVKGTRYKRGHKVFILLLSMTVGNTNIHTVCDLYLVPIGQ